MQTLNSMRPYAKLEPLTDHGILGNYDHFDEYSKFTRNTTSTRLQSTLESSTPSSHGFIEVYSHLPHDRTQPSVMFAHNPPTLYTCGKPSENQRIWDRHLFGRLHVAYDPVEDFESKSASEVTSDCMSTSLSVCISRASLVAWLGKSSENKFRIIELRYYSFTYLICEIPNKDFLLIAIDSTPKVKFGSGYVMGASAALW